MKLAGANLAQIISRVWNGFLVF